MRPVSLMLFALLLGACSQDGKPALSADSVRVFAPLPGRSESVAYFDVHNGGSSSISLTRVSSPQFANAEIHETTIEDGMARMKKLGAVSIAAESGLSFSPGGLHIMLLEPRRALLPGANVQVELTFDDGTILLLDAPVQTRMENPH